MAQVTGLQDRYAPHSACFGCGPANPKGLHVRTIPAAAGEAWAEGKVCATWAEWKPGLEHEAFPGVLNGGIVGALLDCHSNWTAAYHLMQLRAEQQPPCTVTADFHVQLLRPTPTDSVVRVEAWVKSQEGDAVIVESRLVVAGKPTARCTGKFVAVKPGHPAYHRW